MAPDGSTRGRTAKLTVLKGGPMRRLILLVLLAVLLLTGAGVLLLGAFPPGPRTEQVQRVLPNDRFQPR